MLMSPPFSSKQSDTSYYYNRAFPTITCDHVKKMSRHPALSLQFITATMFVHDLCLYITFFLTWFHFLAHLSTRCAIDNTWFGLESKAFCFFQTPLKVKWIVSPNPQATWCWTATARWPWRQPAYSSSPGCLNSTCCHGASSTGSSRCPPTLLTLLPCYSCSSCLMSCRRPSPSRWARTPKMCSGDLLLTYYLPFKRFLNSMLILWGKALSSPSGHWCTGVSICFFCWLCDSQYSHPNIIKSIINSENVMKFIYLMLSWVLFYPDPRACWQVGKVVTLASISI